MGHRALKAPQGTELILWKGAYVLNRITFIGPKPAAEETVRHDLCYRDGARMARGRERGCGRRFD